MRGIAGALMVLNHAGVAWLGNAASPLSATIIFAGGLAPVLFFTSTGMGRGLGGPEVLSGKVGRTITRAAVLLAADAAVWVSSSTRVGLDFLGFIAFSSVVVAIIGRTRRPVMWALVGAALFVMLRFAVAPRLGIPQGSLLWVHFILGDSAVEDFSYPLGPWLAFPLIGYALGRGAARCRTAIMAAPFAWAAALGAVSLVGFAACWALDARGLVFFRWGTMSFAYAALAFSALAAALGASLLLARFARLTRMLSLPGPASLILVPVHYTIVALGTVLGGVGTGGTVFIVPAAIAVILSFVVSKGIAQGLDRCAPFMATRSWLAIAGLLVGALLQVLAVLPPGPDELPIRLGTQLVASVLFVLMTHRVASRSPVVG